MGIYGVYVTTVMHEWKDGKSTKSSEESELTFLLTADKCSNEVGFPNFEVLHRACSKRKLSIVSCNVLSVIIRACYLILIRVLCNCYIRDML